MTIPHDLRIGIPGRPPVPPRPKTIPTSRVDLPPTFFPPDEHTPFVRHSVEAIAAGAGWLEPAAWMYELPESEQGVIRSLSLFAQDLTPATVLVFGLAVNGNPVPGYAEMRFFPRAATSVIDTYDLAVRLPVGARVQVSVRNPEAKGYNVGVHFEGWHYPDLPGE